MFQNTLKAENTLIHLSINPRKNNRNFEFPVSSQEIDAPDSFLISAIKLKTDSFYLEEITKSISISEKILEKSLGQTKAPQKRSVKLTGRAFAGYTGTGVRPSRSSKLSSVPTAVNPTASSAEMFNAPLGGYKVSESKENWKDHAYLQIGSVVQIQHPFKHEKPISAKIVSIGNDGIIALDHEGQSHKIRWQHILDVSPVIHKDSPNGEVSEAMVELSRMGIPIDAPSKMSEHELHEATKHLREIGLPMEEDLINFDKEDTLPLVYQELQHQGIPVDPISLTEQRNLPKEIPEHLHGIISHIQSLGAQIDTKILATLPYDQIMKVLEYYIQRQKEERKK